MTFQKGHKLGLGRKVSEETRVRMSKARIGYKITEKTRQKLHDSHLGHGQSEETKRKIGEASKGKEKSRETRQKLREANIGNKNASGAVRSEEFRRKLGESRSGEKHWNWLGGKSFESYGLEFNNNLKEVIRNRDGRQCLICGKTELTSRDLLSIHHVDYNKRNNNSSNLASLCRSCHTKTNKNRKYWTGILGVDNGNRNNFTSC